MAESGMPVRLPTNNTKVRVDVVDTTTTYVGFSAPGAVTSAAVWRVQRITNHVSGNLEVDFADGNVEFDNIWDNRASLDYS